METKHTKGEWYWFWNGYYFEIRGTEALSPNISVTIISKKDHPNFDDNDICEKPEAESNAKLIAAAPDLLHAAIFYIENFEKDDPQGMTGEAIYHNLKDAIKKATE